jgi:hypothetical protein
MYKKKTVPIFGQKLIAIGSVLNAAINELDEWPQILDEETREEIKAAIEEAMHPIIKKNSHL